MRSEGVPAGGVRNDRQMTISQEKKLFAVLAVLFTGILLYRVFSVEVPRTQPLQYTRGMKVTTPVRQGVSGAGAERDPISIMLARRVEAYPGVTRDLFRMQGDGNLRKTKTVVPVVTLPTPTAVMMETAPQKTPEEIAVEVARVDLASFRFLGYLMDKTDKDSSLFLSKDGELFIAKSGDKLLKSYRIKESGKDFVVLQDTVTKVEVRVELTGSGDAKPR